jgi:tetratricopeptide (TPR) repeat protein
MLRMRLTGEDEKQMMKTYTANPEAYADYLKGRYWWNKTTPEGFNKGIEYFQQAIAKDPNYALAYAGLSDCYGSLAGFSIVPPHEAFPKAKAAALKAMEIDDTLSEAHASLAWVKSVFDWDWQGGYKEFERAIELNPGDVTAYRRYSLTLPATGQFEKAIAESRRAVELDPLSLINNWALGDSLYMARQYSQSIEQQRKTLEIEPDFPPSLDSLGLDYVQQSMYVEGIAELEKALVIAPGNTESLGRLGYGYALAGKKAEAQKALAQLDEAAKKRYVSGMHYALIYLGLGQTDKAFEWMRKSFEEHDVSPIFAAPPFRDAARADPRIADLFRRAHLQP